jgi:hypothetical protein
MRRPMTVPTTTVTTFSSVPVRNIGSATDVRRHETVG